MEEYKVVEKPNEAALLGRMTQYIYAMQKAKYGNKSADDVMERATRIFQDALKQKSNPVLNNNMLLVGKVQSGKTSNLEMLTAVAFDNGFNMMIIYGGYDNTLLKQTTDRFRKTFSLEGSDNEYAPLLLSTGEPDDLVALNDEILDDLIDEGKPIIITSMKRPDALEKVNTVLKHLDLTKVNAYIIDDEGDQASLNTEKDKVNDSSSTYSKIVEMKRILGNPIYFSVTATPHANIFLDEISQLQPASARLIEPAKGYCGGERYHMGNSEQIFPIDPDDTVVLEEGRMPGSLKLALYHYVLASSIMKKRGERKTTMIIHSYRNKDPHSVIYTMVEGFAKELWSNVQDDELRDIRLRELNQAYEKLFAEDVRLQYPFDGIMDDIMFVSKRMVRPILKNSDGKKTQGLEDMRPYKIYIGGDLLQRGVTFDNLVTTYYTRWAIQGNMDTNLQRARWFGYREKYLDLCKVFTTKEISEQYSILTDIELELWEQFYEVQNGDRQIADMVISADSTKQRPTRTNVVSVEKLYFSKNWMKQRLGIFDEQVVAKNNNSVNRFIESMNWTDTTAGRRDDNISASYVKVDTNQALQFIESIEEIFQHEPFDIKYLKMLLQEEQEIFFIKMPDNDGKGRKRTFYTDNIINNIHQGPDTSDVAARKYDGDTAVIIDQNRINIQIHKITPYKEQELISGCTQYMFAIRIPGSKKYYVRKE